ncbi:MFS transporter [Actinomyces viscosus]|uniref:Enterobactin exporter EntS n=1 Tax=Actinomyces viscosus TaxID=1656 RepID=A0A3S4WHX7_ACTVI|nr:MFS transporter [Actinomyces viscosus]TFH51058.1 MFS transporter [Actinomyces viscosus]VEI14391.1 enterobactin exporter EntS [Actinomyces viscosus]
MKRVGLLVLGSFINSLGTGLTAFGLAIIMLRTYGTASSVAAVQMSAFAPVVLLAPLAGALADRYDRRLMMIIGDAGSVLGLSIILLALSSPRPSLAWVCAGAVLSSCLAALTEPALRASVTDLVTEEDYVRSSGLLQLASAAKYLLAPAAAGFLMPLVGVRGLVLLDASTCLVTVACTITVRRALAAEAPQRDAVQQGDDHDVLAGWRTIVSSRGLRTLVTLMTLATLAIGVIQVLIKPILLPIVSTSEMGVIETVSATGMLVGAGLVTAWKSAQPTTLLAVGLAGTGAAMVLVPLRPGAWWVAACGFLTFASLPLSQAGAEVLVRTRVDNARQARTWGTISLVTQMGYLLAYLCSGVLVDRVLQPLLAPGQPLSTGLGTIVGTGPGRGAALLVGLMGLVMALVALNVRLRRRRLA